MNQRQRKNIIELVRISLLLFCVGYVLLNRLSIPYLIASIVIPQVIAWLLGTILPKATSPTDKRNKQSIKSSRPKKISSKKLSYTELMTEKIDNLSGEDFEKLVYYYFKDKKFKPQLTEKSGDHGVDLVIEDPNDGLKIAVQCKRWKNNVGNGDLIKLHGGKRFYKCQKSLFITTSFYTPKAKEFASECNIDTWNGLQVQSKIDGWRKRKNNI
ncbi:restriction endonuclease [Sporolactobacillus terrae]|uniref:Restriction endonuclease n=1 Tax=Sporolactobacillus terrae TaxID=269673 RepID=A0ABX5Q8M7_9BACL|nr:restriction endonuclease [Sporolactobacillus terrae]QAA22975.1 restriction endonuclease [Sporolactobacillus terrae]QAA25948.1 restriction endonuclease [Sporolactobacillus terrae]UAK15048.1 restriction endonuclease [Sporolactobacillus terrae]